MGVDFYLNPPKDDDPIDWACPFGQACCEDCRSDGENFEDAKFCCEHVGIT